MARSSPKSLKSRIALFSARAEACLSSHAFEILFLSAYVLAAALMFLWGAHDEFHHIRLNVEQKGEESFKWLIAPARGAGISLNLNSALVLLLGCRLLITKFRETPLYRILPLDKCFPAAHVVVGYVIVAATIIHVFFHCVLLLKFNKWDKFEWWSYSMSVITGAVLMIILAAMFYTALPKVRKSLFRTFHAVHIICAFLFTVLLIFHGVEHKVPETYKYITGPIVVYCIDRLIRHLKISSATLQLAADQSTLMCSGEILRLKINKPFDFRAGQYAEIRVPAISSEWHPFTMASAPHEKEMVFYVKTFGNWTISLLAKIEEGQDSGTTLAINVRGPFGAPAQHVGTFERVVLISGGIGSTPFASIAKHIHHYSTVQDLPADNFVRRNSGRSILTETDNGNTNISASIGKIFGIEMEEADHDKAVDQVHAEQLTNVLNMSTDFGKDHSRHISSVNIARRSSTSHDRDLDGVDEVPKGQVRQRATHHEKVFKMKLFLFLHSTRVSLSLLFTLIIRTVIGCVITIFNLEKMQFEKRGMAPRARWLLLLSNILAIVFTFMMSTIIFLEMSYMRRRFFKSTTRVLDAFVLLPVSALSCVLGFRAWAGFEQVNAVIILHYIIFLPLIFVLLSVRMYRSTKLRDLLSAERVVKRKGVVSTQDVDFLWTTPRNADDEWLREELCPLANGSDLRLHRYVTREAEVDPECGDFFVSSHTGRPKWDSFFQGIAASSENQSEIGVFFCGPPAMGNAVRRSLQAVEILSNLRGAFFRASTDESVEHYLELNPETDLGQLRLYGSNVRFVFREENF